MAQPYPLPREIRSTGALAFDGASVTFGPFDFKIFDTVDVVVEVKHASDAEWTATDAVTVTKTAADTLDTFSVTFDAIHPATSTFRVRGARLHERSVGLAKGIGLDLVELEKEVSKQGLVLQETRADAGLRDADRDRSLRAPDGETVSPAPALSDRANRVLGFDANGNPVAMVPSATDAEAVANTYPRRSANNNVWEAKTPAEVLTDILDGNFPPVAWDSETTFERGNAAYHGSALYYLDAPSSTGDDPASGAPWIEVFDLSDLTSFETIDNTPIGQTTPAAGSFTTLTASSISSATLDAITTDLDAAEITIASNTGRIDALEARTTLKVWKSGPQVIIAGGALTLPHTLGQRPDGVQVWLICKAANNGFAVGDEIEPDRWQMGGTQAFGCRVKIDDDANIKIKFSIGGQAFGTLKDDGYGLKLNNTDWDMEVRAWAWV